MTNKTNSALSMKLFEDNRLYKKFYSDTYCDINGYQKLYKDLLTDVKIDPANYSPDMRRWLAQNGIDNETENN